MTSTLSIPRRFLFGSWVTLFALLLFLPLFQQISHWLPEKALSGFRYQTESFPTWTMKTWRRAEFAAAADAWIREHVGLRGWMVQLNRQLRYSLFGQVEPAPLRKRAIVIGKGNQMYENILLIDALRPPQIPPEKMEAFATSLKRTQKLLQEHGMAFLVILAPNKAIVYPDALPRWARKQISDYRSDYRPFMDALQRHNVPHLDTLALFREQQPQYPDLISPHAMHWNNQGAWIAWQSAIPLINQQGVLPEIPVPATEGVVFDSPTSMNDELRMQLNLFFSRHHDPVPSAYPVVAPLPPGTGTPIHALLIGDSFGMTLMDAMARSGLCQDIHLWFYMARGKVAIPPAYDSHERRYLADIQGQEEISRGTDENGRRMLEGKNLVLVVITTFNIDKFCWGFDRIINRLYGNPADNLPLSEDVPVDLEK